MPDPTATAARTNCAANFQPGRSWTMSSTNPTSPIARVRNVTVSIGLGIRNAKTHSEKVIRIETPPNLATEDWLQRSARGCTSQPFLRAIWIVAAVVKTAAGKVAMKGKILRHMRKGTALLNLLVLGVLNYGANDLVQGPLGRVTETKVSLLQVRDSVLHVLELLTI